MHQSPIDNDNYRQTKLIWFLVDCLLALKLPILLELATCDLDDSMGLLWSMLLAVLFRFLRAVDGAWERDMHA